MIWIEAAALRSPVPVQVELRDDASEMFQDAEKSEKNLFGVYVAPYLRPREIRHVKQITANTGSIYLYSRTLDMVQAGR
jgi:hypothetical protein